MASKEKTGATMSEFIRFECRTCKKVTEQVERIVTHNLPPNVKVLECTVCGIMGVCLLEGSDAQL